MDFLEGLNPRQREAAEHLEGPLLVLAGAGSGKTRVITHRIAHLMTAHKVPGWAVLAVTFTNKAAGEMRERVRSLVPTEGGRGADLSTFHSFCVRLLRREGAPLAEIRRGFTPKFSIYDDDDQISLLKSVYKNLGLDDKFMAHRAALSRISHAKSHKQSPEEIANAAADPTTERFAVVYERYQAKLLEANALDFDDLLLEAVRLLSHDSATRERLNGRYEFVMVDEYQDTNRSQYELMRLLTKQRGNVAVVGDEDQSIYGWRGANIRNILDFERDFPGAVVIRLEQNYRSTKNILEAASAVVANNTERIGKWLWTEAGAGEKISLYEAPDAENEALWIADQIEARLARNPHETVAVLYRTNSQSRQIEEALRRYGRKYVVVGGFSFYQRAEVKDVLAYLRVLVTPSDSVSFVRIVNTPARGIGRTTVEQIEQFATGQGISLWAAMEQMIEPRPSPALLAPALLSLEQNGLAPEPPRLPARAETALQVFHRLMEELASAIETRPVAETVRAILERTGYRQGLEHEGTEEAQGRLANLDELLNAAADADERGETLREFLDHAALISDADQVDQHAPVSLLTMHNAKGLEFPVVFIAGMEEGLFPHSRSLDSPSAMEEERRLCYVAMTRAEKKLYLSWARYRRRFGGGLPEASIRSRFIKEAPVALIENASVSRPGSTGMVDLYAEQHMVRETVRKNLYTGKTYNSVDAIRQFFGGAQAPQANVTPQVNVASQASLTPTKVTPAQTSSPPQRPAVSGQPVQRVAAPATRKKVGLGATIEHSKYGRGTIVRLEGSGEDTKVTVSFPGYGLKKLVAKYAGIKIE
jgi:DNA helicase-2/ATP-dependent DNA helicase PcrA